MTNVVVDAYAWIQYADGSEEGDRARNYIEGATDFTPANVLAELSDKATRTGRRSRWTETLAPFIRRQTTIVPLDGDRAKRAGKIKWELREASPQAGLADAIVLATARDFDAQVLTGDPDFLVPALTEEVIDLTTGGG